MLPLKFRQRHTEVMMHLMSMKDHENTEAKLIQTVQQRAVAFQKAFDRCRERRRGTVQECLDPAARTYRDALDAFSELILTGTN